MKLQLDSTVVFENYTEPTDGSNRYSWNFGDGSATSNQVHPYHTFPAFDTLFRVCLKATNDCGTYTYCDTVYIDSAHWGALRQAQGPPSRQAPLDRTQGPKFERAQIQASKIQETGIEAILYPNPTQGNTTLQYNLSENATFIITDAQGKLVWKTELNASGQSPSSVLRPPSSNLLTTPSQTFANGIYFYALQHALGSARGKIVVQR